MGDNKYNNPRKVKHRHAKRAHDHVAAISMFRAQIIHLAALPTVTITVVPEQLSKSSISGRFNDIAIDRVWEAFDVPTCSHTPGASVPCP